LTNTKDKLLRFILSEAPNEHIISAIKAVTAENADSAVPALPDAFEDARSKPIQAPAWPATGTPDASDTNDAAQLAALLAKLAGKGTLDEKRVLDICIGHGEMLQSIFKKDIHAALESFRAPTVVHYIPAENAAPKDMGIQHKHFPTLLKKAQARHDGHKLNIWMKGPAGSGKTTAAKHVAKALDQDFQFNGAISTEYELMGFRDAGGTYHTTAFREIFEHGGVYLFDEVDSSLPKAVLAFNAALANGECRFPDRMVTRHKDCLILAGANTAGNGATSDFVGRMKQDLAFLNRFILQDWPLDETLEKALSSNAQWVARVQAMRKKIADRGIKGHIISPRATFYGQALLAAGIDVEEVEQSVLRGALTDDVWASIC
jgi:hypothetical protein